jgi:hypothetical protein
MQRNLIGKKSHFLARAQFLATSDTHLTYITIDRRDDRNQKMAKEIERINPKPQGYRVTCVHPAWRAFITLCESIQFGEIEKLNIQDGLPSMAEGVRKKTKFNKN